MKKSLFIIIGLIGLNFYALAAMDLSDPAALHVMHYAAETPTTQTYLGYSCDLSENFAVVGVKGYQSNSGGYIRYRKTPAAKWVVDKQELFPLGQKAYGYDVAIDENTMLVGAPDATVAGLEKVGEVYIERKNTLGQWAYSASITQNVVLAKSYFGRAVAVDGDTVAVGAPGYLSSRGAVYIFTYENNTWSQEAMLLSDLPEVGDKFGGAVALKGDTLVVGARYANGNGVSSGKAFVFKRTNGTWTQVKRWYGPSANDYFGTAVALDEQTVVVGIPKTGGGAVGGVYLFDATDDAFPSILYIAGTAGDSSDFGRAVSVDGNLLAIGAMSAGATDIGEVCIYQYDGSTWQPKRTLPHDGLPDFSRLGWSVAVKRNHVLAGAPFATEDGKANAGCAFMADLSQTWMVNGTESQGQLGARVAMSQTHMITTAPREDTGGKNDSGAAYMYRRKGRNWVLEQKITDPYPAVDNWFGEACDLFRNTLAISAPASSGNNQHSGSLYIYERDGTSWQKKGHASGGRDNCYLGQEVAVGNGVVAMTSYRYRSALDATRSVVIYARNAEGNWRWQDVLYSPNGYGADMEFGSDMAFDGDILIVGASGANTDDGAAFLYKWNGNDWAIRVIISPTTDKERMGASVVAADGVVAIGSPEYSSLKGRIIVYERDDVALENARFFYGPDPQNGDQFGSSIAIAEQGKTLLIGARGREVEGLDRAGVVYVYRKDAAGDWTYDGIIYSPDDGNVAKYDGFGDEIAAAGSSLAVGTKLANLPVGNNAGRTTVVEVTPRVAPADFDGDGITDIGCYYAPGGNWYVFKSATSVLWENKFGYDGTTPFVNDFDGDWITDFGCFDSATANWYGFDSSDGFWSSAFGNVGTQRITGDFDGDGLADIGYFDSSIPMVTGWMITART